MITLAPNDNPNVPEAPEEKHRFVQQLFNRIAPTYDALNDVISFGLHRRWKRKACAALALSQGQTVLDVCTGTGHLADYLLPLVGENGQFVGLDFSEGMLAVARKRFVQPNAKWVQGDAMALPFENDSFDGAIIAFGLRNVTDRLKTLQEMTRVVKAGGKVVCLDTNPKPKLPGFWLYFKLVMPWLGQSLAKDKAAYDYLQSSTKNFVDAKQLHTLFEEAGLVAVESHPLQWGACMLTVGRVS
jgi:demethylmenaquinone methyltransferase / 2-methoxy-6-polyprenyl-1,4-benzoquinol methylase